MARPLYIRTQAEIQDRIFEAVKRGDQGDEFNEYMRCAKFIPLILKAVYEDTDEEDWTDLEHPGEVSCEHAKEINRVALAMLPQLERAMRRPDGARTTRLIRQFRAWKWLLGHDDADEFNGYKRRGPNLTPIQIYKYLLKQVTTGQWDRMIGQNRQKGKSNAQSYSTQELCSGRAVQDARQCTDAKPVDSEVITRAATLTHQHPGLS